MSIIFRILSKAIKPNLPKFSEKFGIQGIKVRPTTAMDLIVEDNKEPEKYLRNRKHTRYQKRSMKRQWEEKTPDTKNCGESEEKKLCENTVERIKRKKMVILLGYCGVDYYGMQRNPGVKTIEEELMRALWEAKYVTEDDFNNPQNANFQRSSRTDKGVSAARQVVSLKLPLEVNIEEINKRLPECIRVFAVKKVTKKFNSKSKCNARTYSYTLPTYVFEPSLVSVEERKQYRITPEKLDEVNAVLGVYKGTKSYHNFTEKKYFHDPSASRYMMGFSIDKIFIESDMEFAVLLVKGQSFMLHQIRKMIGLAIAVIRGHTEKSILDKAFGKEKVIIPTAPGLGLVLDKVHYDQYDVKFKVSHGSLVWDGEEGAIQKFIHEHIYPVIVKGEAEDHSMGIWLDENLVRHSYEPSEDVPGDKSVDDEDKEIGDDDDDDEIDDVDNDEEVDKKVIGENIDDKKNVKNIDKQSVVTVENDSVQGNLPSNVLNVNTVKETDDVSKNAIISDIENKT